MLCNAATRAIEDVLEDEQVAGLLSINITAEPRNSLPVANPVPLRQQISAGKRDADPEAEVDGWRIMQLLNKHSLRESAMHFDYVHTATSSAQSLVQGTVVPRKRPAPVHAKDATGLTAMAVLTVGLAVIRSVKFAGPGTF